jgi:hypothetical protein
MPLKVEMLRLFIAIPVPLLLHLAPLGRRWLEKILLEREDNLTASPSPPLTTGIARIVVVALSLALSRHALVKIDIHVDTRSPFVAGNPFVTALANAPRIS